MCRDFSSVFLALGVSHIQCLLELHDLADQAGRAAVCFRTVWGTAPLQRTSVHFQSCSQALVPPWSWPGPRGVPDDVSVSDGGVPNDGERGLAVFVLLLPPLLRADCRVL